VIPLSSILKYRPTPSQQQTAFVVFILLSCIFYIVVREYVPLFVWQWGTHDDGLFMDLGHNLANGDWLGPYSRFTLMKGPGYPAFLAVAYWLGVQVSFMHALFHCLAVTVFAWVVLRISKSRLLAVSIFLITLWHPSVFTVGRILRANIYAPQTILLLAVFSYALFMADGRAQRIKWGLLAGLILGWFWLTREEGVWILPGIGFLLLFEWMRKRSREAFKKTMESTVPMVAVCLSMVFAFSFANWMVYDKFVGVDFKEKNFKAALSVLQSVRVGEPIPYLPVSRAVRERIYEVSPSFATLKDYLDPPEGSPWQLYCQFYPKTCGDMAGSLMWWALRTGVASQGHYQSPEKASLFYGAIASEVKTACDDGRLDCEESWFSFLPVITGDQLSKIPATTLTIIRRLIDPNGFNPVFQKSVGDSEDFSKTLAFLNHPAHFPQQFAAGNNFMLRRKEENWALVRGWYYDRKKGDEWFTIDFDCPDNSNPRFSMDRKRSRDIVAHFHDPKASRQRFDIMVDHKIGCNLVVLNRRGGKLSLKVEEMIQGAPKQWNVGSGIFYVDSANKPFNQPPARLKKAHHRPPKIEEQWTIINGWYYDSKKGDDWFQAGLNCPDHSVPMFQPDRSGSLDLVKHFNDVKAVRQRFWILVKYQKDCHLIISSSGLRRLNLNIEEIIKTVPKGWQSGTGQIFIDSAKVNPFRGDIRIRTSYKIRSKLYQVYQTGFPLLVWIGLMSFLGGIPLMWKRRTWPVLFALAATCWISIAVRIVILALIDISSFPAITSHYLLPAYLLLCIAPILSIAAVVSITWDRSHPRNIGEPPPVAI